MKQDSLKYMLCAQEELQKHLANSVKWNVDPRSLDTLGALYEYLRDNKIALDDEFREIVDALPDSSLDARARSALWKKWKAKHQELESIKVSEQSLQQAQEEFIDLWHLVLNMALALKLDSTKLIELYRKKNKENLRRYSEKY